MDLAEEVVRLIEEDKSDFTFLRRFSLHQRKDRSDCKEKYTVLTAWISSANPRRKSIRSNLSDSGICRYVSLRRSILSDDAKKLGRPSGFRISIRSAKVSAGAGFVVALAGDIMTMPGLPKIPAAENIDVDSTGKISGLF